MPLFGGGKTNRRHGLNYWKVLGFSHPRLRPIRCWGILLIMKAFLVLLLISAEAFAHDTSGLITRRNCPQAPVPNPVPTLQSLMPKLEANNIEILSGNTVSPSNVARFLTEYDKFPPTLRAEMVGRGAKIRLMEGTGVGIDRSLRATRTTEGTRNWVDVPGSGGMIDGETNVPTRIAVNHLYDKHGASNLVLHEHAHTLDSIYGRQSVSNSNVWKNLMATTPKSSEFTRQICGQYCLDREEERFAELFSYYFACEETRKHLEEEVPAIAEFFSKINTIRTVVNGTDPRGDNVARAPAAPAETSTDDSSKEECVTEDIKNSGPIKPIANLVPYVEKLSVPNNSLRGYSGGSTSAAGMK